MSQCAECGHHTADHGSRGCLVVMSRSTGVYVEGRASRILCDCAFVPGDKEEDCEHDFVNPANAIVEDNGWEVCLRCGLLRPPAPAQENEPCRCWCHGGNKPMGPCLCGLDA